MRKRAHAWLGLLPLLAGAAHAQEAPADDGAVDCSASPDERPPDARCGEPLDGRPPPRAAPSLAAARLVLWGPKLVSRAVFWPVVGTSDLVERYQLVGWTRALLTTDDGLVGVRPELSYSTSFRPAGGLRFFYRRFPEDAQVTARFMTGGPSVVLAQAEARGPARLGLVLGATWNRRNDRLFAGVGPNSAADLAAQGLGGARYGSDMLATELRWTHPLPAGLAAGLHVDVQRRDYQATDVGERPSVAEVYDPAALPGFARGLRVAHLGGKLALDRRSRGRDAGGISLALGTTYGQGLAGDPSRHLLTTGETVLAVGGHDRLLLLRAWAAAVEPLGPAPVPFEELVMPAGPAGMRGFPDGRFRGESGVVGTAEYRWFIAFDLDASLFVDVGTVAGRRFEDLRWDRWFPSVGVGVRVVRPTGPYWTTPADTGVQVAYAPDGGVRLLLALAAF